jgi:hypothetical protein
MDRKMEETEDDGLVEGETKGEKIWREKQRKVEQSLRHQN